jgi:sugar phosphate isomerase/epimerase
VHPPVTDSFFDLTTLSQLLWLHRERGLDIISGIATDGQTAKDHLESLKRQVEEAMAFSPKLINSHTGRDIFSLSDNMMLFEQALLLQEQYGVTITHETHRFRPTFSTLGTEQIIEQLRQLKLNLDISHWFVVHEAGLTLQKSNSFFKAVWRHLFP